MTGKCLMGGLERMDITNGNKNELCNQIYKTIKTLGNKKYILTPGCVIRYPIDDDMQRFVKQAKNCIEERLKDCKK